MHRDWFREFASKITWIEFNQNFQISLLYKFVYVETAKVACSTIKSRLYPYILNGLHPPKEVHPGVFGSPFARPFQLPNDVNKRIISGDDFFRFTFVREPVERVLSAYLDKITRETPQRKRFVAEFKPELEDDGTISLNTFLNIVRDCGESRKIDKHWRSLDSLTFQGLMDYEFIGCFARFEQDWLKVLDHLGLEIPESEESVTWHATSAGSKIDEYVTTENRKLIEEVYAKDFELYESVLKNV